MPSGEAVVRPARGFRSRGLLATLAAVALIAGLAPSSAAEETWEWRLPAGFPAPRVPPDNPMSAAKVTLGRRLFYDTRLSANHTQACGTCHRQEKAFTDGRARAVGSTGEAHRRSSMSLANASYPVSLTWAGERPRALEEQVLIPLLGTRPVELGMGGREEELAARLQAVPEYEALFREAFPGEARPVGVANVARAIAAFERTLVSGDSPYDRLVFQGKMEALSESAWRGMRLFFSESLACSRCHAGFNFSGPVDYEALEETPEAMFHNTGLYNLDDKGAYPETDTGLRETTGRRRDMGRFKAPTLRNIAVTAPYMHDGSVATLEEVIDHYARGGRAGGESRAKSPLLRGFAIGEDGRRDLIEFLRSLTDETFLTDPRHADPSSPEPGR
jgi:cytochrome c peroxidase